MILIDINDYTKQKTFLFIASRLQNQYIFFPVQHYKAKINLVFPLW